MKWLFSLVGLAIFASGIYALWVLYPLFNSLTLGEFGAGLGLSFLATTVGFFLFLVNLRPKSLSFVTPTSEDIVSQETSESSGDEDTTEILLEAETVQMDAVSFEAPESSLTETASPTQEEPDTQWTDDLTCDETRVHLQLDLDEPTASGHEPIKHVSNSSNELIRLMDIEPWAHQRYLKKIKDGTELHLQMKQKHGLNLAMIQHQGHDLGYISKLDYLKFADRLASLERIEIAERVVEGSKIVYVGLRFIFLT